MLSKRAGLVCGLGLALLGSACGVETVVNRIDEREANRILELLETKNIPVNKVMIDTGREQYFNIAVPARNRLNAVQLLNQFEMPAPKARGYDQAFGGDTGLIPTQAQENAKKMSALEGEIERQLRLVPGVLDVEVQIVIPTDNPLRTQETQPPTASVTVKYLPGANGAKPLSEPTVQGLVANGVEKLSPDRVYVYMVPSSTMLSGEGGATTSGTPTLSQVWRNPQARIAAIIGAIGLIAVCIIAFYLYGRLNTVRSRLIRLQTEIARVKKKPETAPVPVS